MDDDNLWGLGFLSAAVRWFISLNTVIAVPALMFSGITIVTSELAGGFALASDSTFQFITSLSQSIGIEGAFFGTIIQSRKAWTEGKKGPSLFLLSIGMLIGSVGALAMMAGNYETAFHLNTAGALAALGINAGVWALIRAGVYFVVSTADAYSLYVPKKQLTDDQVKDLLHQKELRAQIAQKNAEIAEQNTRNRVALVRGTIAQLTGKPEQDTDENAQGNQGDLERGTSNISDENLDGLGNETQEVSDDNAGANTQENDGDSQGKPPAIVRRIGSAIEWDWRIYQEYVSNTYGITISEKDARVVVYEVGGHTRSDNATGRPYVAIKKDLIARAKKDYSTSNSGKNTRRKVANAE